MLFFTVVMNKMTENNLFCMTCDCRTGKQSVPLSLHFEFIVGNATHVPAGYSTQWRTMPFHLCSFSPDLSDGSETRIFFRNRDELRTCRRGSIVFIPAGTTHRVDDRGAPRTSVWLHFRTWMMNGTDIFTWSRALPFIRENPPPEIPGLMNDILRLPKILNTGLSLRLQLCGIALSRHLLELGGVRPENIPDPVSGARERLQPVLEQLDHAERKPDLEELAASVNLSVSRFLALFKKEIGISAGQYFKQVQFTRACRLLADPERTAAECAELLGYCDQFHFSRDFHKLSGMTLTEYRRQFHHST